MTSSELSSLIFQKQSVLCVGLDSDIEKIPTFLRSEPHAQFLFNKAIIDATLEFAVAYKLNTAFYESQGIDGWVSLQKTVQYIRSLQEKVFIIADAKRADIGNTSAQYAKTFFDPAAAGIDVDAVTVSPYMGYDSVEPFLSYAGKWVIVLALTSNRGADDFQLLPLQNGRLLFEEVLMKTRHWGGPDNIMYVVGATRAEQLQRIRQVVPEHFLLIPGVGAQGGDMEEVLTNGLHARGGLLINVSRSIIFARTDNNFQLGAFTEAKKLQQAMKKFLSLLAK